MNESWADLHMCIGLPAGVAEALCRKEPRFKG
jgi:hypothetical protein